MLWMGTTMYLLTEEVASRAVGMPEAIEAVERAFLELQRNEAEVFPVVMGRGNLRENLFSVKSGVIDARSLVGLKVGSYWPGNAHLGLAAHASTTFLLDPQTGMPMAFIASSHLTALRTAASDGVAIRYLSRPESSTLGIVGAGRQAWFEVCAACAVRPIRHVLVWSRAHDDAHTLADRIRRELGIEATVTSLPDTVSGADIVITITASREPLVRRDWVRAGTHISAMGSDAPGKHELDADLVSSSYLFADVVQQSVTLGDFESCHAAGAIQLSDITAIGAVIDGSAAGRISPDSVTIYDSSGMALQDLAIAEIALANSIRQGWAQRVPFNETYPSNPNLHHERAMP